MLPPALRRIARALIAEHGLEPAPALCLAVAAVRATSGPLTEPSLAVWDTARRVMGAVELAAVNKHHVRGTAYHWTHNYHPLDVATALLWHKRQVAKSLHASGAGHFHSEPAWWWRSHPDAPKTLPIGTHGGITDAHHLELLPQHRPHRGVPDLGKEHALQGIAQTYADAAGAPKKPKGAVKKDQKPVGTYPSVTAAMKAAGPLTADTGTDHYIVAGQKPSTFHLVTGRPTTGAYTTAVLSDDGERVDFVHHTGAGSTSTIASVPKGFRPKRAATATPKPVTPTPGMAGWVAEYKAAPDLPAGTPPAALAFQKAVKTGQTWYTGPGFEDPTTDKVPFGIAAHPDGAMTWVGGANEGMVVGPGLTKAFLTGADAKTSLAAKPKTAKPKTKAAPQPKVDYLRTAPPAPDTEPEGLLSGFGPGAGGEGLAGLSPSQREHLKGTPEASYLATDNPRLATESDLAYHYKATTAISTVEHNTVLSYQGFWAGDINGLLRTGQAPSPQDKTKIGRLDRAIAGYSLPAPVLVARGLGSQHFPTENLVGKIVQDQGYMSTSLDTAGFGGEIQMHLLVPKGSQALPTAGAGKNMGEGELILPRGSQVVVSRDEIDPNGTRHITGTVVPTPPGTRPVTGVTSKASAGSGAYTKDALLYLQEFGVAAWRTKYGVAPIAAPG